MLIRKLVIEETSIPFDKELKKMFNKRNVDLANIAQEVSPHEMMYPVEDVWEAMSYNKDTDKEILEFFK